MVAEGPRAQMLAGDFICANTHIHGKYVNAVHTCALADKTSIKCETPYCALPAIFHIMHHFLPSSLAVSPFRTDIDLETVLTVK